MLLVRRLYPKRLTYSILRTIPTGALWGEVSQGHNDMLTAVGFEPVLPWSQHQRHIPLRHTPPLLTHLSYGLVQNLAQTFIFPRRCILMCWFSMLSCTTIKRVFFWVELLKDLVLTIISYKEELEFLYPPTFQLNSCFIVEYFDRPYREGVKETTESLDVSDGGVVLNMDCYLQMMWP